MCGICGVIGIADAERAEPLVRRMMNAMIHRGPDGEGLVSRPGAALGMRRLSIIDLPGGDQPVWNEDRTRAVVFNGEIYNYRELRRQLESLGHKFQTQSDTEAIVHAHEEWGSSCVDHLRGMFALALAELPKGERGGIRKVFLARDRMGIKPLYYALAGGKFLFASEVRSLVASGAVPIAISRAALSSYFLFGSISEPLTLLENVRSLPPASYLVIDVQAPTAKLEPQVYWHPPKLLDEAQPQTFETSATRLRSILEESVRMHLLADVPLGVFLSSGIDSTALAALAAPHRKNGEALHTFTLIFPEREFSEAELARKTAVNLGTIHSEVSLSGEQMLTRMDEAVASFDQPSMDGINTYFVSWGARQAGLKVALSGLGSDEMFGGYSTFHAAARLKNLQRLAQNTPNMLRQMAAPAVELLTSAFFAQDAAKKVSSAWSNPEFFDHTYFYTRTVFPPSQLKKIANSDLFSGCPPWEDWIEYATNEAANFDELSQISWLELRTYMLSTLLRDSDGLSMANSLEIRVPFLDHKLVEFTMSLRDNERFKPGQPKALLIEALDGILPADVVKQKKRTFTLPWEHWLRGPLREPVQSGLSKWSDCLEPFFSRRSVDQVWQDFLAERTSWARVWCLYVLNEWVMRHVASFATTEQLNQSRDASQAHLA
jgi:asparagine synthase (glutamine-hydrolysing)